MLPVGFLSGSSLGPEIKDFAFRKLIVLEVKEKHSIVSRIHFLASRSYSNFPPAFPTGQLLWYIPSSYDGIMVWPGRHELTGSMSDMSERSRKSTSLATPKI